MDSKKRIMAVAILMLGAGITLLTSVEHHRIISEGYGPIANIFVPVISLSSFLLGAFIALTFQWGINVIQFEKVVKLLPTNESEVMKLLFAKKSITQSDLSTETCLSRLMVSRIISRLEERGIVTKKPLENTNLIDSRIYQAHPTTKAITNLPGLSERRAIIAVSLVFLFGLSLTLLNSFHVLVLEHPLEPSLYLLAIEFFALGGLANFLLRKRISETQFERILDILPNEEKQLLKEIYLAKTTTQKDLVEKTGVYKMKVSRILQKFEERGVIEKKQYGYTNRITSKIN